MEICVAFAYILTFRGHVKECEGFHILKKGQMEFRAAFTYVSVCFAGVCGGTKGLILIKNVK